MRLGAPPESTASLAFWGALAVSVALNGVAFAVLARSGAPRPMRDGAHVAAGGPGSVRFGLCGPRRRCTTPEVRRHRREPEPTPARLDVLQAELIPALGMRVADPRALPKLQTYEQKEVVADGVNLDRDNPAPPRPMKKRYRPRKARRAPGSVLEAMDMEDDDPRRRPTRVADMVGVVDGDVFGTGDKRKPGSVYLRRLQRELEAGFRVPTHLSEGALRSLTVRVKVTRMGPEGSVLGFRITRKSGNAAFDAAAVSLILRYVPEEDGDARLPVPPEDVLRYINARGLTIDLEGAKLR